MPVDPFFCSDDVLRAGEQSPSPRAPAPGKQLYSVPFHWSAGGIGRSTLLVEAATAKEAAELATAAVRSRPVGGPFGPLQLFGACGGCEAADVAVWPILHRIALTTDIQLP